MLRDREYVSYDAALSKLSMGDFPLMRMASGLPAISARPGDFTHGVSDHREIPTHLIRLAT